MKQLIHCKGVDMIVGTLSIPASISIFLVYTGLDIIINNNPFCALFVEDGILKKTLYANLALINAVSLCLFMLAASLLTALSSFVILDSKSAIYKYEGFFTLKPWVRRIEYIFIVLVILNAAAIIMYSDDFVPVISENEFKTVYSDGLRLSFLFYYILLGSMASLHIYISCAALYNYFRFKRGKIDYDETD